MKLGIFGGGQLARMIALEGYKLGLEINIYDKNENACAKDLAKNFFNYDFLDEEKVDEFFALNDIVTYEFENIDPDFLKKHEAKIPQGVMALELLQDRFVEKNFINSLDGIKCVSFCLANENIVETPFILKTRRFGYDGKGQLLVTDKNTDIEKFKNENYIIEKYLENITEYSIVIARTRSGEMYNYEPLKNVHKKGILKTSTFEKYLDEDIKSKMIEKAKLIAEKLNYIGVLCVEFFVSNGEVYVNEVAPRVHNSGHITIEGANISQFMLHVHAIVDLPIPKISSYSKYYMVNVLGHDMKKMELMQKDKKFARCHFHNYGKNSYDTNRKVGHITFKDSDDLIFNILNNIKGAI